jgi:hypothetical protein
MGKGDRRGSELMNLCDKGHVLLAALMLIFLLGIAGMTSLHLASQDDSGVSAMKEDKIAQQLADAGADLVMSWFHDPSATPVVVAALLVKRQGDLANGPSFFDVAGRSQFVGTADRPDILLDAANQADNQTLNDSPSGFYNALRGLGRILTVKVYGPLQPGLLSTVEVTATTVDRRPVAGRSHEQCSFSSGLYRFLRFARHCKSDRRSEPCSLAVNLPCWCIGEISE